MSSKKTFLGFGLGAVQSGLMLFEAMKSDNFSRYVILEINADLVKTVRNSGYTISINTATDSGIVTSKISGLEIFNPCDPADIPAIDRAISEADEMATAIPSTRHYDSGGEFSIIMLLARNLQPDKPRILYASENNNYAAEILLEKIESKADKASLERFQTINTVIGKMGGVINDPQTIKELGLEYMTPAWHSSVLVEQFNSIIISKILLPGYTRGIQVFQEKDDLLPFEEAKLYGHNAVHAMLGYFAYLRGYKFMSDIRKDPQLYHLGEMAFQNECGAFLLKKYRNLDEPLFTREGFDFYGSDLLKRMTNPYLRDEVDRICRDPLRKLQYHDRFLGPIRETYKQNVSAPIIAQAVLAGLYYVILNKIDIGVALPTRTSCLNRKTVTSVLTDLWKNTDDDGYKQYALELICSQYENFTKTFIRN